MFQYALGRHLSLRNQAVLFLDTFWYTTATDRAYQLDYFNISAKILPDLPRRLYFEFRGRRYRPIWFAMRAAKLPFACIHLRDSQTGFDERVVSAGDNVYLEGDWQSANYFSDTRETLLKEFELVYPTAPVDASMLKQIALSESVCVHVRRGDYTTLENQLIFAACSMQYYRCAMEEIRRRLHRPHFYVFSDDPEWCHSMFSRSPNTTVVSTTPARSAPEELRLMKQCDHFIIANSSFSWWAAWLGSSADKIVIAPKPWFITERYTEKDLIPDNWIRM
jgi:hypothetical protein